MGENFYFKAYIIASSHMTTAEPSQSYSSIVSCNSIRIALTIAALNDLNIEVCNIQNAYSTAPMKEKRYIIAGSEFGSNTGKVILIVRALYGLKTSGAAFRFFLAETFDEIGFKLLYADPDVWIHPAMKDNGFKYWELFLCYVNNLLYVHEDLTIVSKQV